MSPRAEIEPIEPRSEDGDLGRTIAKSYLILEETLAILRAVGYTVDINVENNPSVFGVIPLLANEDISHSRIISESDSLEPEFLNSLMRLLISRDVEVIQAYRQLHRDLEERGERVSSILMDDEARSGVIYSLRMILLPEGVRQERTLAIRSANASAYLSKSMTTNQDLRRRVQERMGNRGYFPQDIEAQWAEHLSQLFQNPETRARFERPNGALNFQEVVNFLEQMARVYDESRSGDYYNGFGPENRNMSQYTDNFLYRKDHTSHSWEIFYQTRTRYGVFDHPTLNFRQIIQTEILADDKISAFLNSKGISRRKIMAYLLEHYGSVDAVYPETGEPVTYTLYVDSISVKNIVRDIKD